MCILTFVKVYSYTHALTHIRTKVEDCKLFGDRAFLVTCLHTDTLQIYIHAYTYTYAHACNIHTYKQQWKAAKCLKTESYMHT